MDDVGRLFWCAGIAFIFILIAMIFSAGEAALRGCSLSMLKKRSEEKEDARAEKLLYQKEHEMSFCLFLGSAARLCMLLAMVLGMMAAVPPLEHGLSGGFPAGSPWAGRIAGILAFVVLSFFILLLADLLPRRLCTYHPEKSAFALSPVLNALSALFRPILLPQLGVTALFMRLTGHDPHLESEEITEEEIRLMVDTGNENGTIEFSEREMINNVFEFDDRTVGEIMTHRTDIAAVPKDGSIEEVLQIALEQGFSRIPVYEDDIDDIVGIIYAKDLLHLALDGDIHQKTIADYMRDVIYVPESTRCGMLFGQFKQHKVHMAVIVDEYGGTAGIATMEDLLESIVGNIQDEYDQETDEIERLDGNGYSIDGGVLIEKVEELFDVDLQSDEDTDTLGGLIANTLGRIPNDGEMPSVEIAGVRFTVLVAEDRRIARVEARRMESPSEEDED